MILNKMNGVIRFVLLFFCSTSAYWSTGVTGLIFEFSNVDSSTMTKLLTVKTGQRALSPSSFNDCS